MTISWPTGIFCIQKCNLCGAKVQHFQTLTLAPQEAGTAAYRYDHSKPGIETWSPKRHKAPCGEVCLGGGVVGSADRGLYEAGRMHGIEGKQCPGCAATVN